MFLSSSICLCFLHPIVFSLFMCNLGIISFIILFGSIVYGSVNLLTETIMD